MYRCASSPTHQLHPLQLSKLMVYLAAAAEQTTLSWLCGGNNKVIQELLFLLFFFFFVKSSSPFSCIAAPHYPIIVKRLLAFSILLFGVRVCFVPILIFQCMNSWLLSHLKDIENWIIVIVKKYVERVTNEPALGLAGDE